MENYDDEDDEGENLMGRACSFLLCNLKQLIWIQSNLYVEKCHVSQEVHSSGQISLRVTHTTDFSQMVVIVREMGPLI